MVRSLRAHLPPPLVPLSICPSSSRECVRAVMRANTLPSPHAHTHKQHDRTHDRSPIARMISPLPEWTGLPDQHMWLTEYLKLPVKSLSKSNSVKYESWNKKEEAYCLCWRYHRKIFVLFLPIFSKIKDAMVFVMSFANIHNASLNESEASHGFKTVQRLCTWNKPLANVLMMFSYVSDHSMPPFFDIYVAISSIHDKIPFEFRFWAHFFALRNTDTRSKIFPTALKKFALRAENMARAEPWDFRLMRVLVVIRRFGRYVK